MEMIGRYLNLFFVLCVCMCDVTIKRKKGILFFFFYIVKYFCFDEVQKQRFSYDKL